MLGADRIDTLAWDRTRAPGPLTTGLTEAELLGNLEAHASR